MVTGCTAHGRALGRVCVLSFRTHQAQIDALVEDWPQRSRTSGHMADQSINRAHLRAIAVQAMRERGLDPEISARRAGAGRPRSPAAPTTTEEPTRDLRSLLWCSIDNDDSRDLDQLSVAEALPRRRRQGARRDRRRGRRGGERIAGRSARGAEHDVGLHAGDHLSDAARAAVDRSDVAGRSAGSPRRSSSSSWSRQTAR